MYLGKEKKVFKTSNYTIAIVLYLALMIYTINTFTSLNFFPNM